MTIAHPETFLARITADPAFAPDAIFAKLSRLLAAPAPANSCTLPGAVGEVISALADELGLTCAPIGSTGNFGIEVGDPSAPLDLLVSAHMDRPCFRVRQLADGTLYPLCAIRVPGDGYSCEAIALRCIDGRVTITARGQMRFDEAAGDYRIRFRAESGELRAGDTVMMYTAPVNCATGRIIGAGVG